MDTPPPVPLPPDLPPPLPEPPPLPRPPRFSLGAAAWIGWGLFGIARFAMLAFLRPGGVSAFASSEAAGEIVAWLLFSTLFALFFWRVCGRSTLAKNLAFFCVLGLLGIGTLATVLQEKIVAEVGKDKFVGNSEKGKPAEKKPMAEILERLNPTSTRLADASKVYMEKLLAAKREYDLSVTRLDSATFWDLSQHDDPEKTAARRQRVNAFLEANATMAIYQDVDGTAFRRELTDRKLPAAQIDGALRGYMSTAGARLPLIMKVRGTDTQFGQVMLDFLEFADKVRGSWQKNATEKLIFEDDADAKTYNELLARVKKIGTEQAGYQKELAGIPMKK